MVLSKMDQHSLRLSAFKLKNNNFFKTKPKAEYLELNLGGLSRRPSSKKLRLRPNALAFGRPLMVNHIDSNLSCNFAFLEIPSTLGVAWIVNERNFGQKWQCVLRLAEIGPPVARLHRYKVSRALLKGTVQNDFVTSSQCAVG